MTETIVVRGACYYACDTPDFRLVRGNLGEENVSCTNCIGLNRTVHGMYDKLRAYGDRSIAVIREQDRRKRSILVYARGHVYRSETFLQIIVSQVARPSEDPNTVSTSTSRIVYLLHTHTHGFSSRVRPF